MTTSSSTKATVPHWAKFAMGGMAGMGATLFCQPLDLVKMRMQVSGEGGSQRFYKNTLDAVVTILRTEGVTGIYTGLTAGLLRQAMYTTSRMGMFHSLMDHISEHGSTNVELTTKIGIGMFSGGVSAFLACPAEVAMIRMSTDAKLPIEKRRDYRNVFNALSRVAKEEGLVTCWKVYKNNRRVIL
jgi:solute carrier family 25 oxoglutarate transporter 11